MMLKIYIATTLSQTYMNTTAGSFALLGSVPPEDAPVAAKLKAAGAIILGKSNLSQCKRSPLQYYAERSQMARVP